VEVNRGKVAPWNLVIMLTVLDAPNLREGKGKGKGKRREKKRGKWG
jgi:hypothetical protein